MSEPIKPKEASILDAKELLKAAAALRECDQTLFDLLSEEVAGLLKTLPDKLEMAYVAIEVGSTEIRKLNEQIYETGLSISEYANQSGQGQMMLKNLALCLDQIRKRRDQRKKMGNQGWG